MPRVDNRKVVLINPRFQLRMISYVLSATIIGMGIMYLANLAFFHQLISEGKNMGLPPHHLYFKFIHQQNIRLNVIFLVVSAVLSLGIFIGGLVLSHKIAGPLYHLCKYSKEITSGKEIGDLNFRKGDFFMEVADSVNELKNYYKEGKHKKVG